MEKKYYRMRGTAIPDPALMGKRLEGRGIQSILLWLRGMESRTKKQKRSGYLTSFAEMNRVARVKRSWKNV